jgi:6-pyruvoyltetrahydropterin/6-carboxytetrahydropterin synthase
MYSISKAFEFCYGHRVWTQQLDGRYADDLKCACRHLHGHEAKVEVHLEAEELNNSMVTDFRHLEWLKRWINQYIDHRFIIDIEDPLRADITMHAVVMQYVVIDCASPHKLGGTFPSVVAREFDLTGIDPQSPRYELLSGFLIVDFVPTSERLAKWMHSIVSQKMWPLAETTQIDWWETPKSKSTYHG